MSTMLILVNKLANREARFYDKIYRKAIKKMARDVLFDIIEKLDGQQQSLQEIKEILALMIEDEYPEYELETLFERALKRRNQCAK